MLFNKNLQDARKAVAKVIKSSNVFTFIGKKTGKMYQAEAMGSHGLIVRLPIDGKQ